MRNILVIDVGEEKENVIVFSETHTTESIESALKEKGLPFEEVVEVPDGELSFYVYEPTWIERQ